MNKNMLSKQKQKLGDPPLKPPLNANPKLGDETKKIDQHGELEQKYLPDNKDSFIEKIPEIINDLSPLDYKELFKHIKQKVETMKDSKKSGLQEIRKIIRRELTTLLEAEVKKIDLKDKMKSVISMDADQFEKDYGHVPGADYALENFDDFKTWLGKQSKLDEPSTTSSGGVDIRSAIKAFKDLPGLKKDFERDMRDEGDRPGAKKDYNKGAVSLKEIGELLQSQGEEVNASNPSSVRNYLGRKIDMPIVRKALERTGKKYKIDLVKLVFDPGFTSWLSSQYKVHHEDKEKDWQSFLYNTIGRKLYKEITSGELERFSGGESKQKVNAAVHNYMKTDSELRNLFDKEYASYYEEVDPDEFDSEEFLKTWFLGDTNDSKEENNLALNGAYETVVDMLDSGDDSLTSMKQKTDLGKDEEEEFEEDEDEFASADDESDEEDDDKDIKKISENIYESLKQKKLILR